MSVDYYSCECCGDALYEEFVSDCEYCGRNLCVECLVNTDEVEKDGNYTHPFHNNEGYIKKEYCPYCSGRIIDDAELLSYVLTKYNIDIEEIKAEFLKSKLINEDIYKVNMEGEI